MANSNVFNPVFDKMAERYKAIFSCIYPAYESTGFTERNLTNNFVAASELVFSSPCLAWFEMPIGQLKQEHLDAVIWNTEEKFIALIEAKRFSNPSYKVRSFLGDISRMASSSIFKDIKVCQDGARYIVALADVWLETKEKKRIFEEWSPEFIKKEWEKYFSASKPFPDSLSSGKCFKFEFSPDQFKSPPRYSYCILGYSAEFVMWGE